MTSTSNMNIKEIIKVTPKDHAEDDVRWEVDGEVKGYGYRSKEGDKEIGLIRCPLCLRENYSMNVSSGLCTWCPFDANNLKSI